MSTDNIARHIRPGDTIAVGQVLGEPTALVEELIARAGQLDGTRLFVGMSLTDVMTRVPPGIGLVSTVAMAPNNALIAAGRMRLIGCHMSQIPWLLTEGPCKADVALVLVSPPDTDGYCSLGAQSDYGWHAVQAARVVLAEVNDNVPVIAGDTRIHVSRLAYTLRTSRPLPEYQRAVPTDLERRIAAHVAPYIRNGSCLQVGIGRLGEALLQAVSDRRDLGVHAGMVGDTLLEMMRDGIITNAKKPNDTGLSIAGSILGSSVAVDLAAREPSLRIVSIAQTHDPARIAAIPDYVCVNSALEVDLLGQVNVETAGGRHVGAIGGSVDFLRAATRSPGGHSIVALPAATGKGHPRIVPRVETVSVLGADVDVIATEYGVAEVRGVPAGERARRIIEIAAPGQREALRAAAATVP
ncbi:MAG TPA: acetyl-CoA hydrolase/transferase C-terminal domain-containing protein [Trebonia sp.]|nr:acetyl-CoA hydrolase/transferase C-terminal domain-containing protein [Trebonia sp.]